MQLRQPSLSIIVPVLDEAAGIADCLGDLAALRERGAEIIVVDGGSRDGTRELAAPFADRVVDSPRGRALQMNAGARLARSATLLFLHADTRLPHGALDAIASGLERSGRAWGRFDVEISGRDSVLPVIAFMMNARSRATGIATGDQAIFVLRDAFEAAGGFPAIPLMEDVALSKILKRRSPPLCLREPVVTSGRRWERRGAFRTILLMWRLRLAYALGADPRHLARRYDVDRASS
jgi:rSAM/selenodomain-associated transferase 2